MSLLACPDCFGATRVVGTVRRQRRRRYRRCTACGLRFVTEETVLDGDPLAGAQRRAADELARRYLALGTQGRATVRRLIAAIEEAEQRGARHEACAVALDAAALADESADARTVVMGRPS